MSAAVEQIEHVVIVMLVVVGTVTGYELARHAQGQGYMREALRAIYAWAFDAMEV